MGRQRAGSPALAFMVGFFGGGAVKGGNTIQYRIQNTQPTHNLTAKGKDAPVSTFELSHPW